MGDEPAALRTRSTRPKLPGLSDRLRVVRLEGDEDVDPLLVAFLRAQEAAAEAEAAVRLANKDASEDVKTGHQMLQYDAAEEDIEWLEELNRKGGTPKARLEKDLSLATFEVLTTAMENLHFDALQQSTKWCNEVKAGRVPVLTQAHVQLTRALAVSKLAQHDAAAVSCVYDRWLQLRRVSQGPLLQHLWFLQPWKAVAFADKSAGHEGELGDMPFVELEKQEGRGGWNRVLAMTSEEALEVLLDVRGGTGAPLRPAHAPKRRKLSTEQACPEALDSLSTVAPASKAAAAGASAPGRHKAAQQAQGECPPESKASKGAGTSQPKGHRELHGLLSRPAHQVRKQLMQQQKKRALHAAANGVLPTSSPPRASHSKPPSPDAGSGRQRDGHTSSHQQHLSSLAQTYADGVAVVHRRGGSTARPTVAGPPSPTAATTVPPTRSNRAPQQPRQSDGTHDNNRVHLPTQAPAPSQASAARPNSRQQPASHSTQPPHPLGAHPPAASSGNSSREGTAAATGTHGRAVRPLRESSRASAVNGPACGTRKHAAPPPDEHPRTQRCAGDAEGAGQPSDAHSQARKGSQAQQLPIPHRGSSAARKSQNCPPAASADLPGARRQQHPVHDAHPLTRASNGRVAGAGALSPHLPPQHPVTAATATATAAVQDLHRHPAPATAKPHRSRSVQTGVPPTHTTGAHTANIASHPSHHSTDGHASDHPTATSGSRNHHPTTRSTAVHGNIHPTGASNKSQRSDMVRNKLGSPVQGVLTSPMKARGGSLASARHAVTKALLAARHGGQHSTRRLNHKQ
ncbi:MAG: hypothetical protein WDW36_006640 [Sanguina aurantia]